MSIQSITGAKRLASAANLVEPPAKRTHAPQLRYRNRPVCAVVLGPDLEDWGPQIQFKEGRSRVNAPIYGVPETIAQASFAVQTACGLPGLHVLAVMAHGRIRADHHQMVMGAGEADPTASELVQCARQTGYNGLIVLAACGIGTQREALSRLPGPTLVVGGSGIVLKDNARQCLLTLIGGMAAWTSAHKGEALPASAMLGYARAVVGDTVALVGLNQPPTIVHITMDALLVAEPDKIRRAYLTDVLNGRVENMRLLRTTWPQDLSGPDVSKEALHIAGRSQNWVVMRELGELGLPWASLLPYVVGIVSKLPELLPKIASELRQYVGDVVEASKLLTALAWDQTPECEHVMATQLCCPDSAHPYNQVVQAFIAAFEQHWPDQAPAAGRAIRLMAAEELVERVQDAAGKEKLMHRLRQMQQEQDQPPGAAATRF